MKTRYMIILAFLLFSQISSLAHLNQNILHTDSINPKVCLLQDGNTLVISTSTGNKELSKMSKLDKVGQPIYENMQLDLSFSAEGELVEAKSDNKEERDYYLFYHAKPEFKESKEKTATFDDSGNTYLSIKVRNNTIYEKTSVLSLKNGKMIIAGINVVPDGADAPLDIILYDPKTEKNIDGFSIIAHSKHISCFEQTDNDPYCVYVSVDNVFIRKFAVLHLRMNDHGFENVNKEDIKVIKTFHTNFNFMKAVPLNTTDFLILFQAGNGDNTYLGNSGKNLYFYHLGKDEEGDIVAKRYEFLYDNCLFEERTEKYNADIIALSDKTIYAVCETEENKFKGFIIYPGTKKIDKFFFDNFEANTVKHPVFAKFGKILALFYTRVKDTLTKETAYFLINFPDCSDFGEGLKVPRHLYRESDLSGKVFLSNSYPANKQSEKVLVRITNEAHMKIINAETNEIIELNKDFDPETSLRFYPTNMSLSENYVEYTTTRQDSKDGLIIGKTCKIKLITPVCLIQCKTCTRRGTDISHQCLGCIDGYYKADDPTNPIDEGFGIPHNCYPCNESCTNCYGPFLDIPFPGKTTNCKRAECNFDEGYYPLFIDNRTCISYETKEYWENVIGRAIFLDNSTGSDKTQWVWQLCHKNCKKCEELGDDENNKCIYCIDKYHFFCNQTLKNGGIPGTCYTGYENNGYYITPNTSEFEYREKYCNCLDECKVCTNATICKECYDPFYLSYPNHDACVDDCGYCLVKTKIEGINTCINCADEDLYTLNISHVPIEERGGRINDICINENEVLEKKLLVVDPTCKRVFKCKEGCGNCTKWDSDSCTKCEKDYYKEDFFGLEQPKTFRCFNKTTCLGTTPYKHNETLRIGGVTVEEDGVKVCLNCKLRNDSFRQPEDDFYCGPERKRTFIDIPEYNKLTECYFRCKTCEAWGNECVMNCTSCRDATYYDLIQYDGRKGYGNCYKKTHKCGIYPYYHDYDLAEEKGLDEDNCGQECDVCLYNFSCTQNFPYFVYATHECVEFCPLTDIFGEKCNLSNSAAGIDLLRNPFGLRNPYDFLNSSVEINQIISSSLFEYIMKSYNLNSNEVKNEITNYLGKGQIYNLPESKIIVGNNISIELSSVRLELEKLADILSGKKSEQTSTLDISECSKLLKKKYGLSDEEDLMVIKGDLLKEYNEYLGQTTEYQLFSTSLGAFLPLSACEEAGTTVTVINPFESLLGSFQNRESYQSVADNGYNVFDYESPFYNDICAPFTNENGNDVLLEDRRKDYFNEKLNLCEEGCQFVEYSISSNTITCKCNTKSAPGETSKEYTSLESKKMPENFKDYISKRSNIEVFKCSSQVFSSQGQKNNFGSYVLLAGLASFIGTIVFHFLKEKARMAHNFDDLIEKNNIPSNPPKPVAAKEDKHSKKEKHEKKEEKHHQKDNKKDTNIKVREGKKIREENIAQPSKHPLSKPRHLKKDLTLTDMQLNFAPYETAVEKDKRSFLKYYWSLLKMKQLCIFTFYTSEDYILRTSKIVLFILFVSFYFAFTALFFNDSIMRAIYIYKGNTNAAVHVPNIILSSLCCLIMSLIVRFVSLNERDISKILQCPIDERTKLVSNLKQMLKIKLYILYGVAGALIALCWYYVAAFCAVFKNSQGHYFVNVLVAFIVCNAWPCVISLIPAFLRKKALDLRTSENLYKVSQIISYF